MNALYSKNLISTKEAAELSGYSADYLARLARRDEVKGTQVGRTWLVERESLLRFMKKNGRSKKELAGLVSTKEASKLFGYTPDYLARLARNGDVKGMQVGRTWLVERESLAQFLRTLDERKEARALALARAREAEYRELHSPLRGVKRTFSKPLPIPPFNVTRHIGHRVSERNIGRSSLHTHVLALLIAFAVITSSAFVAKAGVPELAARTGEIIGEISSGFNDTFGDIPSRIATRINAATITMHTVSKHVARDNSRIFAQNTFPFFIAFNFSSLQMPIENSRHVSRTTLVPRSLPAQTAPTTIEKMRIVAIGAYALATHPSRVADSLARAYVAIGTNVYAAIVTSLSSYHSLVEKFGAQSLNLAAVVRDTLADAPEFVERVNLAFGTAIIDATHMAIRADVAFAYASAEVAPRSARAAVALIGGAGDLLVNVASRAPSFATTIFLRTTEVPAHIAPVIAEAVFNAGYEASARLITLTGTVSRQYLALVFDTGRLAYDGVASSLALASASWQAIAAAPIVFEDVYLGILSKGAFALGSLDSLVRMPEIAAVITAVQPTLTIGEQVALATYETIHGFFTSVGRMLARLFGPLPMYVQLTPSTRRTVTIVATSTVSRILVIENTSSLPRDSIVYQTTVGISPNVMNQSLASLRTEILEVIARMPAPERTISRGSQWDSSGSNISYTAGFVGIGTESPSEALSVTGNGLFSGSVTASSLALSSALPVSSGGTASTTLGGILVGNGTSEIKSLTVGTNLTFDGTTLDATGGGTGIGTVSTSTNETAGRLAYWTTTNGTPATLGEVSTTTLTFSGPFSGYAALGTLVSGADSTVTWTGLATTTALSQGNLLYSSNGTAGVTSVATSSPV